MTRLLVLALTLLVALPAVSIAQDDVPGTAGATGRGRRGDNPKHPKGAEQFELRQKALKERLEGRGSGRVHQVAGGQFVELAQERSDRIFVVIAEFGNHDPPCDGRHAGTAAQPDCGAQSRPGQHHHLAGRLRPRPLRADVLLRRARRRHDAELLPHAVVGTVRVHRRRHRVGEGATSTRRATAPTCCGSNVCSTVWALVRDAINIWTAGKIAGGMTPAAGQGLPRHLRRVGSLRLRRRRQLRRARRLHRPLPDRPRRAKGRRRAAGRRAPTPSGATGGMPSSTCIGSTGPAFNKAGGTQFGTTGMWVGDYTIQPENGGLGVFAHEYAHDLGLPDHYDTNGGENSTGFWTIMSSGQLQRRRHRGHRLAAERLQRLGEVSARLAELRGVVRRAASPRTNSAPRKRTPNRRRASSRSSRLKPRTLTLAPTVRRHLCVVGRQRPPTSTTSMTRTVALPAAASVTLLTARLVRHRDELGLRLRVGLHQRRHHLHEPGQAPSPPTPTRTARTSATASPAPPRGWVAVTLQPHAVRRPDDHAAPPLLDRRVRATARASCSTSVDQADGGTVFTDGAESSPNGWTLTGFKQTTGSETTFHNHYYVTEFRQYRTFDATLETGPYNFSYVDHARFVDHFPYQDGMPDQLLGYVDGRQQHERAPRRRADPADRRAPDAVDSRRRQPVASPRAGLRLDVRPAAAPIRSLWGLPTSRPAFSTR